MITVHRFCLASALLTLIVGGCDSEQPLQPSIEAAVRAGNGSTPVAPSNANATAASYSQINVSWQDNSTNETGFEVHRSTTGTSGVFSLLASTGAGATSYSNSGLSPSTQYCYEIRAFRTTGSKTSYSAFSSLACATTLAPPVPAAPSNVSAAPTPWGGIHVTWTDNATNETGFRIERSATDSGPWTTLVTATGWTNLVSYDDRQPPAAEQPACYRVFAFNGFGDSGPSNHACTAIPNTPTDLAATVLSDGTAVLTWTDNSAVEDGYEVLRSDANGVGQRVVATLPANTTEYHDVGLPDGSYGYNVSATKDGGASPRSWFVTAVVATRPPAAPTEVDAVPSSSGSITIDWFESSTTQTGFRVERSSDGGVSWTTVGTLGATSFYDGGLSSEQQMCYRVIAFNGLGDSDPSNSDCATPPAGPTSLQAAPAEIRGAIDLSWTDNSNVEDGYQVLQWQFLGYSCDDYGNCYESWDYAPIATLGPNSTTYRSSGLTSGQSYSYVVVALKDGGQSDRSNEAAATAP